MSEPSTSTKKEIVEMQFQIILHLRGGNPYALSVDKMASYLMVAKAILRSMLRQHLLGDIFLTDSDPYNISSASRVLSDIAFHG